MQQRFNQAVFLDIDSVDTGDLELTALEQSVEHWQFYPAAQPEQAAGYLHAADVAATNKVVLDKTLLTQLPQLKLICIAATGINNVDINTAKELGISICNVTGYATASVSQHVLRLILALNGRLTENNQAAFNGQWSDSAYFCLLNYPPQELSGKTLGLIGYGELGKAVAHLARSFGLNVLIARRNAEDKRTGRLALEEMLPQVDILSLHCPLTPQNYHLIDKPELNLLPDHALVINTARGGLINESALLEALQNGTIAGAALDVLEQEPPDRNHPLLQYNNPRLIITPHIAWASQQSRQRLLNEVALNILAYQQGTTRNAV